METSGLSDSQEPLPSLTSGAQHRSSWAEMAHLKEMGFGFVRLEVEVGNAVARGCPWDGGALGPNTATGEVP